MGMKTLIAGMILFTSIFAHGEEIKLTPEDFEPWKLEIPSQADQLDAEKMRAQMRANPLYQLNQNFPEFRLHHRSNSKPFISLLIDSEGTESYKIVAAMLMKIYAFIDKTPRFENFFFKTAPEHTLYAFIPSGMYTEFTNKCIQVYPDEAQLIKDRRDVGYLHLKTITVLTNKEVSIRKMMHQICEYMAVGKHEDTAKIPDWLKEGFASMVCRESFGYDGYSDPDPKNGSWTTQLRKAAFAKKLLTWPEQMGQLPETWTDLDKAYFRSMVSFLYKTNTESFCLSVKMIGKNVDAKTAIETAYKKSFSELQGLWAAWIMRNE
jgi:hypothetical protein